jgi:small subunit ribosomal protein S8
MVNDPVGDFIIQIKNASATKKTAVAIPFSKLKFAVASKLQEVGYIKSVTKRGKKIRKSIKVELIYTPETNAPRVSGVKRVSKPGKRIYSNVGHLRPIRGGKGSLILSTPKGILTGEEARKEHVGGEALFLIW